jgi:hypothetical protein
MFQSNEPPETITVSSFAQKFRPRNMIPFMTPPRYLLDPSSPKLNNDPLLSGSPAIKSKSIPSDGTVGGFPVKLLDMVVCTTALILFQYSSRKVTTIIMPSDMCVICKLEVNKLQEFSSENSNEFCVYLYNIWNVHSKLKCCFELTTFEA